MRTARHLDEPGSADVLARLRNRRPHLEPERRPTDARLTKRWPLIFLEIHGEPSSNEMLSRNKKTNNYSEKGGHQANQMQWRQHQSSCSPRRRRPHPHQRHPHSPSSPSPLLFQSIGLATQEELAARVPAQSVYRVRAVEVLVDHALYGKNSI
jgi:hypothetical protein